MKTLAFCTTLVLAYSFAVSAQDKAPAPKAAVKSTAPVAQKSTAAKSTTAAKAATPAAAKPNPALMTPANLKAKAPDVFKARFVTTKGDIVIEVTRAWAPLGADRFYNLVKNGFYTNAAFFRVISGFMVQFGISAWPEVNRVWRDARIADDPVKQSNTRGMVSYAMGGPNTRTSQVFINFGSNVNLDGSGFAPFGKVVEGMDVVDKLYAGYGEGAPNGKGPDQGLLQGKGKPYLDSDFPLLDKTLSASIVGGPAAAPAKPAAAKPAAAKPTTAAPKPAAAKPAVPAK